MVSCVLTRRYFLPMPRYQCRALSVNMALTKRVLKLIFSWITFACVTGARISIQGRNGRFISHGFIKWTHDCICAPFTDTQTQLNQQIGNRKQKFTGSHPWVVIGRFRSILFVSFPKGFLKFKVRAVFSKGAVIKCLAIRKEHYENQAARNKRFSYTNCLRHSSVPELSLPRAL